MADTKISALTDGTPAVATDNLPAQRGAGNVRLAIADIRNLLLGTEVANGATVTTNQPVMALSQTWNAGAVTFNGITLTVTNTASAAVSALLNLIVGSQSRFQVMPAGPTATDTEVVFTNAAGTGVLRLYSSSGNFVFRNEASGVNRGTVQISSSGAVTLTSTNSQLITLSANGGVRVAHNSVNIDLTCATGTLIIPAAVRTLSTTVTSLPSAATAGAGARAFVTDATATTFLSTVAGGGANKVPVVSDGTNWLIG